MNVLFLISSIWYIYNKAVSVSPVSFAITFLPRFDRNLLCLISDNEMSDDIAIILVTFRLFLLEHKSIVSSRTEYHSQATNEF